MLKCCRNQSSDFRPLFDLTSSKHLNSNKANSITASINLYEFHQAALFLFGSGAASYKAKVRSLQFRRVFVENSFRSNLRRFSSASNCVVNIFASAVRRHKRRQRHRPSVPAIKIAILNAPVTRASTENVYSTGSICTSPLDSLKIDRFLRVRLAA